MIYKYFTEGISLIDYKDGDKNLPYEIVQEFLGEKLDRLNYEQLFPYKQPEDGGINDDGEANDYYKLVGKAPTGWKMDWVNPKIKKSKQLFKKSDLEKRRAQTTQGKVTGKDTSAADKLLRRNDRILSFGEFITEGVMKDLLKAGKSKKDSEITLDDGADIPIDPLTSQILVKYIEGLSSSEKNRTIQQIQRTERAFMKVLGKAHESI